MTTTAPPTISVELPEPFDPRWNRLPGITIDGWRITIDLATCLFLDELLPVADLDQIGPEERRTLR